MSEKIEGLDVELLAAIVSDPGVSITDITEQFLVKASRSTVRRYLKELIALGCITARKETVLRPTDAGIKFLGKCRRGPSEGGQAP
jgi:predicted transcriptional regulator